MELKFNVIGNRRKEMVKVISETIGEKAVYKYMPTCAFEIGAFTVDKEGALIFEADTDKSTIQAVLEALEAAGFTSEDSYEITEETDDAPAEEAACEPSTETAESPAEEQDEAAESDSEDIADGQDTDAPDSFSISLPHTLFTDTALQNLNSLLEAKGTLIKKALGIFDLPIVVTDEQIIFPWFGSIPSPEEVHAYTTFIAKLGEMARTAKRVTATEKEVDNEKYAFRCFLLRLGFIGDEYKNDRKILLRNLSGSGAFKSGKKKESAATSDEQVSAEDSVEGGEQA